MLLENPNIPRLDMEIIYLLLQQFLENRTMDMMEMEMDLDMEGVENVTNLEKQRNK